MAKQNGDGSDSGPWFEGLMNQPQSKVKLSWPTLQGRLSHPLTSRAVAARHLQITVPLSKLALNVLQRSKDAPMSGRGPTAG
jgi:hypothetical protein